MMSIIIPLFLCCLAVASGGAASAATDESNSNGPVYGVDVSWPMHHEKVSTNYPWLTHNVVSDAPVPDKYKGMPLQPLGDVVNERYQKFMDGCYSYYEQKKPGKGIRCNETEEDRIEMTLRQPRSMYNYTKQGYLKIRAPNHVYNLIKSFWEKNKNKKSIERWSTGNIYTNHWEAPTYMVSVEDPTLEGGGYVIKQHIWNAARDTIEEWTGQKVKECSLYGIRIYTSGAILAPHVDRHPLVSSAIINVDQDVDEPWPLEVIGHDGIARNVTMKPGDMVLYESHSVIHGRHFPMKGRYFANVFIHFEPITAVGGKEAHSGDLPPYIIPGSKEDKRWRLENPGGHKVTQQYTSGATNAHRFAAHGNYDELLKYVNRNKESVTDRDVNGWTPLAEAVNQGHESIVRLLLDRGSEANARLGKERDGGSILHMALEEHPEDHPVILLLKSRGARVIEPDN